MPNIQPGKSLREQLAPVSAAFREGRAHVQPVSQITWRLKPGKHGDRFQETVREILRWMNNRAGKELPDEAWGMNSFEMSDVGAQRTAAIGITDPLYWAARLDDADKEVARRTWITEIGVGLDANLDVIFGTRLICATRGENPPFEPTVPGFVRSILAAGPCELDGQLVDGRPHVVSAESDADWLVRLLEKRDRAGDVIVLSHQEDDGTIPETMLNAERLAGKLRGIAHVVTLSSVGSFALTDRVGKDLSVFRQAVRTYRPGFRAWLDEPSRHPLAMPARILSWRNGGAAGFEADLCSRAITNTAYIPGREERLPSFTTVRQIAAKLERDAARRSGATDSELLKMFEDDNQRLATEIQEQKELSEQLLIEAEEERDAANERANEAVVQAMLASARIRKLEEKLAAAAERTAETTIPNDLLNFEDWCKENLAGSVVVHNRAFQGAKKSEYQDPALIYRVLLVLRDKYVPMRIYGGAESQEAYTSALAELHVEESATGEGAKFEGDEYAVKYQGRRRILDRHLKSGNSREPRFCMRVYFFWDDESQVVVVGWLPSHLENRLS
jgi:hypothetical protein